jgi:hypothetical protein
VLGVQLAGYQDEILAALVARRRVAVRGPHGLGKTALAAWAVLWGLGTFGDDAKIVTTASAWRQLTKFLWPEIRKWGARWSESGMIMQQINAYRGQAEAFAVASNHPALIEGAHAARLLYVFDEARAIPDATWDAVEGAFATGECYALAISTPGEPAGRFYDIHSRKAGYEEWWTRHVTLAEAVEAGRVSNEWAEARKRQWGEGSAVYQNRVLGEFASSAEDGVIPLAWVELANARWHEWQERRQSGGADEFVSVGVDVGRGGDQSVLALRFRAGIAELRRSGKADVMDTTGRVKGVLDAHPGGQAVVDVIGIGAGVVDRLREQGCPVVAFNAAAATQMRDHSGELGFANLRAAAWWSLREMLDPSNGEGMALPPDDTLTGDLTAPHWRVLSGGKIQIESKDDIHGRLGRSTDDGDAVVMAMWAGREPGPPEVRVRWL